MTRRQDDVPTNAFIWQAVRQNHEQQEQGHERLRADFRSLESRITSMETAQVANALKFAKIEATPTDVTKLHFAAPVVVSIVIAALAVAGGQWAMNATLKADVLKAIEQQSVVINSMQRRQELQQYEIQRLSEAINKLGGTK